jgi:hypothetical protein
MAQSKSLRGADAQLYINGNIFPICTGVRWRADTGRHAIYGIDQMTPFELALGQVSIKGTVECLRQRQDGGLEGRGVTAPEHSILLEKYFSMALVDRSTDTLIFVIDEASVGGQSWSINAKGQLIGNFDFEGIAWSNEADT